MPVYHCLTNPDDASFCTLVSVALQNGWQLCGSPALSFNGEHIICGQTPLDTH